MNKSGTIRNYKKYSGYSGSKNKKGEGMKTSGGFMVIGVVVLIVQLVTTIASEYSYDKDYASLWELADKSSTIEAKADYISQFVEQIETNKDKFSKHNAVVFKTPNNEFSNNLKALVSLRDRLYEINKMDPASFQYNTAIQQITEQEQGDAFQLTSTLKSCYKLGSYWIVWGWVGGLICFLAIMFTAVPVIIWTERS
jgi:hypothetical protein